MRAAVSRNLYGSVWRMLPEASMASTTARVSRVEAAAACAGKAQEPAGKSVKIKIRRAAEKKPRFLSLPLKTIKRFSSIVCRKDIVS